MKYRIKKCCNCGAVALWKSTTSCKIVTYWCARCHDEVAEYNRRLRSNVHWTEIREQVEREQKAATTCKVLHATLKNMAHICRVIRDEKLIVPRKSSRLREFERGLSQAI